jgi:hypothetical protein
MSEHGDVINSNHPFLSSPARVIPIISSISIDDDNDNKTNSNFSNNDNNNHLEEQSIYLPGAASLIDQIDSRILIVLRDGRNLIGTMRSFDQYVNLILEDTIERVIFDG